MGAPEQAGDEKGIETTSLHPRRLDVMLNQELVASPGAYQSQVFLPVASGPHKEAGGETRHFHLSQP